MEQQIISYLLKEPILYEKLLGEGVLEEVLPSYTDELTVLAYFFKKYRKLPYNLETANSVANQLRLLDKVDMEDCYNLTMDEDYVRDYLSTEVYRIVFTKEAVKVADELDKGNKSVIDKTRSKLGKLEELFAEELDDTDYFGDFWTEREETEDTKKEILPTPFRKLNSLRSFGGWYAPELHCIMAGEKSFKTGLLLHIAAFYVKMGHVVYFADTENGSKSIYDRFDQTLFNVEATEIKQLKRSTWYKNYKNLLSKDTGDFICDYFPAGQSQVRDMADRLKALSKVKKPKIIIIDNIDNFAGDNNKPENIVISDNYKKVAALLNKHHCIGITPSHISEIDKRADATNYYHSGQTAGDKTKQRKVHSLLSINRDDTDLGAGLARLVANIQREGVSFDRLPKNDEIRASVLVCYRLCEETAYIEEITLEEYLADRASYEAGKTKKFVKPSNL